MSGYFEPFGKSLPAPPPPAGVTARNNQAKNRDSIVSTESDLDSMLGMYSSGGTRRQSCPLHKTHPNLQHNSSKNTLQNDATGSASNPADVKHLKGILKGGSMNKPNDQLNGSYAPTTKITSITTNPVATAALGIHPSSQKTVIVSSSAYREKSLSPNSSSTTSSPSPPPLAPLADYTGNRVGNNINDSKIHASQKSQDNSVMKLVKMPSLTPTTLNHSKGQLLSLKQTNSSNPNPAISSGHPKPPEKVLSNSSSSSSFSVRDTNSSTSTVSGSLQCKNSGGNVEALNV